MPTLSHKTTLLLSKADYANLQETSRASKKTMGELIRTAIRTLYQPAKKKSSGWQKLFSANAPVSDWENMEQDIQRGRLKK
jgi:hypothetical protein